MDIAEFESFLREHEKDVFSFCCYLAMDKDKAEDLYQDTVLQAFEAVDRIDATQNPKSFFFSIAVGKWRNIRRKTGRRNAIAPTVLLEDQTADIPGGDDIEHHMENNLLLDCIQNVLAEMDDKFRIPIILFYFDECSEDVIAKICKIPKGTVKSRLHKGRSLLKQALVKEEFDYE